MIDLLDKKARSFSGNSKKSSALRFISFEDGKFGRSVNKLPGIATSPVSLF
jgi:hypothetical protein